jgi:hypothetical protein
VEEVEEEEDRRKEGRKEEKKKETGISISSPGKAKATAKFFRGSKPGSGSLCRLRLAEYSWRAPGRTGIAELRRQASPRSDDYDTYIQYIQYTDD